MSSMSHVVENSIKRIEQMEKVEEVKAILDSATRMAKDAKKVKDKELYADMVKVQMRAKRRLGQMVFGGAEQDR